MLLVVIALEMLFVRQMFGWGLTSLILGVVIAFSSSNYEIVEWMMANLLRKLE